MARKAAAEILALPIYPDLALQDVHRICDMIEALCKKADRSATQPRRDAALTVDVIQSVSGAEEHDILH